MKKYLPKFKKLILNLDQIMKKFDRKESFVCTGGENEKIKVE